MNKVCKTNVVGPDGKNRRKGSPVPDNWDEDSLKSLEESGGVVEVDDETFQKLQDALKVVRTEDDRSARLIATVQINNLLDGES